LEKEVQELMAPAEAADRTPEATKLDVPAELARRKDRQAKGEPAKRDIEARFEEPRKERPAVVVKNIVSGSDLGEALFRNVV
jgi:hypothetical protein